MTSSLDDTGSHKVSRKRLSRDQYYIALAQVASRRSTCPKRQVGAVLVANDAVASTGYNGSPPGMPHCEDAGCDLENGKCVRTVHAEINAIVHGPGHAATRGASLYSTILPCWACFRVALSAGIKAVYYADEGTPDSQVLEAAIASGVKLAKV